MIVHGFSVSSWDIKFRNILWASLPCNKPEISDRNKKAEIGRIQNQWIDEKNVDYFQYQLFWKYQK